MKTYSLGIDDASTQIQRMRVNLSVKGTAHAREWRACQRCGVPREYSQEALNEQ